MSKQFTLPTVIECHYGAAEPIMFNPSRIDDDMLTIIVQSRLEAKFRDSYAGPMKDAKDADKAFTMDDRKACATAVLESIYAGLWSKTGAATLNPVIFELRKLVADAYIRNGYKAVDAQKKSMTPKVSLKELCDATKKNFDKSWEAYNLKAEEIVSLRNTALGDDDIA